MRSDQAPEIRVFSVSQAGNRLDRFLAGACPDLSRSQIQKLIESGYITVNAHPQRQALKLKTGDAVRITIPPPEPVLLVPENIPLRAVYEDPDVVIIDKPAGLTVHPAPGHVQHTLVNALLNRYPDLEVFGSSLRPGIVHRLDKDTSGLIVVARNEKTRQYLINQFKLRQVKKGYLVLVRGRLAPERGAIEAPVGRDPSNRKRMAVVSSGREARTTYRVIKYVDGYTYLEAQIETGRTHQIRVHFAAIGHPVAGDTVYGMRNPLLKRQFLHAYHLELRLPSDGRVHVFSCDLPPDLEGVLKTLRVTNK
ncbi:MAG: RluA family pseudouridine synthase [Dehalococcoidia bacterium]|nr:RluA family pseudouridine synthase [Dehalococcoidia bacterium]MDD5495428.1 RluA family pseudouridine synthase [Dehalococcoidia bacterium]